MRKYYLLIVNALSSISIKESIRIKQEEINRNQNIAKKEKKTRKQELQKKLDLLRNIYINMHFALMNKLLIESMERVYEKMFPYFAPIDINEEQQPQSEEEVLIEDIKERYENYPKNWLENVLRNYSSMSEELKLLEKQYNKNEILKNIIQHAQTRLRIIQEQIQRMIQDKARAQVFPINNIHNCMDLVG